MYCFDIIAAGKTIIPKIHWNRQSQFHNSWTIFKCVWINFCNCIGDNDFSNICIVLKCFIPDFYYTIRYYNFAMIRNAFFYGCFCGIFIRKSIINRPDTNSCAPSIIIYSPWINRSRISSIYNTITALKCIFCGWPRRMLRDQWKYRRLGIFFQRYQSWILWIGPRSAVLQ